MIKTTLEHAKIGSIILRDVYGMDGKLLAERGSAYHESYGRRFQAHGIQEIFVNDEGKMTTGTVSTIQKSLKIHDVIHEKTRSHANAQMKKTMQRIKSVSNTNIYKLSKLVEQMIEELLQKKDFVLALSQMRSVDDYTYQHSVNVGVLSLMIGINLGIQQEGLRRLGIGAMLHDVGKIMVKEEIIKKPSQLTTAEYIEVQKHTVYGYEMLRQTDISEESALIALNHHEKFDGSGYGLSLKGDQIPVFSRIVAVADVYDAMSNDRIYQKRVPHDQVYREITHLGGRHFDTHIMQKFAKNINIYPTGTGVILNTGHRGIVLEQNVLYPESPRIRVFTPEKRDIKNMCFDLDLSMHREMNIKDTF